MTRRIVELAAFEGDGTEIARWTCGPTPAAIVAALSEPTEPRVAAYVERGEGYTVIVPGFGIVLPSVYGDDPHAWIAGRDLLHDDPREPAPRGPTITIRAGTFQSGDSDALRAALARHPMYGGCRETVTRA